VEVSALGQSRPSSCSTNDEKDLICSSNPAHRRFQVLKTTDPARAFEVLASHPVRIVISDQNMPGMTGVEFLIRVRKLYPA